MFDQVVRLKGLDDLVACIKQLRSKTATKAAKAGVNAALGVLAKTMRTAINASDASSQMKRAARLMIGKRLMVKEGTPTIGKVGFAVAKRVKAVNPLDRPETAERAATAKRYLAGKYRGVGISAYNIHWAVLGTQDRFVGLKQRKSKVTKTWNRAKETGNPIHYVGRMPPILKGVVEKAVVSAQAAAMEAARKKIAEVLAAEAAKARKG